MTVHSQSLHLGERNFSTFGDKEMNVRKMRDVKKTQNPHPFFYCSGKAFTMKNCPLPVVEGNLMYSTPFLSGDG